MHSYDRLVAFSRRERKGSEKRVIGVRNIQRMLPNSPNGKHGGRIPEGVFSGDTMLMSMEDSYCDMWGREDIIDRRIRSMLTIALMVAVGDVGNQEELRLHAPAAVYNGVTVGELEAIIVQARAYVGSPCAANAMRTISAALKSADMLSDHLPVADVARRERTGSEKREIARGVLHAIDPGSPLIELGDELPEDTFAPELAYMELENIFFDLWDRTNILDHRTRSIVTLGFAMAVPNHDALRAHVPVALRNGLSVPELEEFVYHAATYLGYMAGKSLRTTVREGLEDAGVILSANSVASDRAES
jgi:4-carboxymuconolactone decarboxylase